MSRLVCVLALLGCSDKPSPARPAPPADACTAAVDKVLAMMGRRGHEIDAAYRSGVLEACRSQPADPMTACVNRATTDDEIDACMRPAPKGEPGDQLAEITQQLRTYFFVHETFTDQKIPLTPAKPCCEFPAKKCPPEPQPDPYLADVLKLDLTVERSFQYRFESSGKKAVIEAIGDRDCDGKTVTYRRELEHRDDGNMHITVTDPRDADD